MTITPAALNACHRNTTFKHIVACLSTLFVLSGCTALRVVTHSVNANPIEAPAGNYILDPNHYSVLFDVDHLHYIRFVARFDRVHATLHFDPDWAKSGVDAEIDANSIDTNVTLLDKILTGDQLLDAKNYPKILFKSTAFTPTSATTGKLTGLLTVRDKSIPVTLDVVFNGAAPDPLTRVPTMGFSASGTFSRAALGLATWYPAVGDDVNVRIQAEFTKTMPRQ